MNYYILPLLHRNKINKNKLFKVLTKAFQVIKNWKQKQNQNKRTNEMKIMKNLSLNLC